MRQNRYLGIILSLVLLIGLILPAVVYADKPDDDENCEATNIKVLKKMGLDAGALNGKLPPIARSHGHGDQGAPGILGRPLPPGGNRYAVLIGISDYPGDGSVLQGGPDLFYADDDAVDMLGVLTGVYGFDPSKINLLMGPGDIAAHGMGNPATRENILTAIRELKKKVTPKDEVVFQFSGHAVQGVAQDWDAERVDTGILPCDSDLTNPSNSIIWDGQLRKAFNRVNANRVIFIFDCCNAGGMTNLQGPNRIVCASVGQNGIAVEYGPAYGPPIDPVGEVNNGIFTFFFAEVGMGAGFADLNGNGAVAVEEAFNFAQGTISGYMGMILPMLEQFGYSGLTAQDETPVMVDRFPGDLLL
ncbi:MAG: caspase family protein [Dehalococcoidia bacterium]